VVAATHRDLEADVRAGRFREDLYYRLNVLRIPVPPMRERGRDLAALAETLLDRLAASLGVRRPVLPPAAIDALAAWSWPGNVRELGNVLERILVLRDREAGAIDADDVRAALGRGPPARTASGDRDPVGGTLAESVAAVERHEIEAALRHARGVKTQAARALGISRPTLDKKIAELGIDLWREP
jgi:DNA-binding NtrC family response regulator